MIGVALHERALRHAMKTHHQFIGPPLLVPGAPDTGRNRLKIVGIIVKIPDQAQFGQVAPRAEFAGDLVKHSARGGAGILGIHRQHQQALQVTLAQLPKNTAHGGIAIAHGHRDLDRLPARVQCKLQTLRLALGIDP